MSNSVASFPFTVMTANVVNITGKNRIISLRYEAQRTHGGHAARRCGVSDGIYIGPYTVHSTARQDGTHYVGNEVVRKQMIPGRTTPTPRGAPNDRTKNDPDAEHSR